MPVHVFLITNKSADIIDHKEILDHMKREDKKEWYKNRTHVKLFRFNVTVAEFLNIMGFFHTMYPGNGEGSGYYEIVPEELRDLAESVFIKPAPPATPVFRALPYPF